MAGHSHSANIAHRKAAVDNKRSKVWSKISKAILVAVKMGGGDPDMNLRLRYAILDARSVSMPKDNIERAIKSGLGELGGANVEECLYEGYGPGGVAIICEIMTDNRNRTASEIRKIFDIHGGKLGATNCVAWMFERKGIFLIAADKASEEQLMEVALEAGADDIHHEGEQFEVTCPLDAFNAVSNALDAANIPVETKQITRISANTVDVTDVETAKTILKLLEQLDDHDDVQSVSANYEMSDEVMAAASE
jgi:YebC/PmpR family DNA-binding regulatory protein